MSQLILESENESNLKLIQQLAEKLAIHCLFISQVTVQQPNTDNDEMDEIIQFVKNFSQDKTSFGEPSTWQRIERQERLLDGT